jgi:predicted nucleic acid-binding protein
VNFVLDASVALSWAFADERTDSSMEVLGHLRESEAVTSAIWPLEVTNALLVAERRGRIEPAPSTRFCALLLELPIVVEPLERSRVFGDTRRLARIHGISSYDASYLAIAVRLGIPLATGDEALARAARDEGVEVMGS